MQLDVETWANSALHAVPALAVAASYWYALLHYVATPAVLVWAWHRSSALAGGYRRVRNALTAGGARTPAPRRASGR